MRMNYRYSVDLQVARGSARFATGWALVVVLGASLLGLSACSDDKAKALAPDEAKKLLIDRNWLDRWPVDAKEKLHVLRFVPKMGGGVYQDRTLFAGSFELFTFEHDGKQIRFVFPHTKGKATVAYRIDAVSDRAPFDLRLTLADAVRGPKVYYGFRQEPAALSKRLGLERSGVR